jgi:hypothetical protein
LQSKGLELPDGAIEMVRPLIFDAGKLRKELLDNNPKAKAALAAAKKHDKGGAPSQSIVAELLEAVMAPHAPAFRAIIESLGGGKKKEAATSESENAGAPKEQKADASKADTADKGEGGDPKALLETSRSLMGTGGTASNWGTDGSLKDEGLEHPAFAGSAKKGGYKGSFKCNIFVGEALFRSGYMSPGSGEDHQPTHHYQDVNEIAADIETVAAGGKPASGAQWFDVVDKKEARPGDIVVIRGKWRNDIHRLTPDGDENHGHIEILSEVERDDGNGQIRHIKTIGAGSSMAHETSHDGRTTFGKEKKGEYDFDDHTWVIRPRIR